MHVASLVVLMVVREEASDFLADISRVRSPQLFLFTSGNHRRLLWLPHEAASSFLLQNITARLHIASLVVLMVVPEEANDFLADMVHDQVLNFHQRS